MNRDISELSQAIVPPPRWSPIAWLVTMLVIALLMGCVIFLPLEEGATFILVGLLGIVYLICLVWLQYRWQNGYFTNGFLLRKFFRSVPILFEDIESYALIRIKKRSMTDMLFGKPGIQQYRIVFFLKEDCSPSKVKILFPENDSRFDPFFYYLKTAIAARMAILFQKEKQFDWTPNIRVSEGGIEWRPDLKDAMARSIFIPWNKIKGGRFREISTSRSESARAFWHFVSALEILVAPLTIAFGNIIRPSKEENMVLHIYRHGNPDPEILISCLLPNFHPGYDVFRQILFEEWNVII